MRIPEQLDAPLTSERLIKALYVYATEQHNWPSVLELTNKQFSELMLDCNALMFWYSPTIEPKFYGLPIEIANNIVRRN